jgi:hypothetical protein
MKKIIQLVIFGFSLITILLACQKEDSISPTPPPDQDKGGGGGGNNPPASTTLSYGDSILYRHPSASGGNIVSPKNLNSRGTFYAFPRGIELDSTTGNIDLAESEMGLRYRIMFVPQGTTDTISTKVVLAGINFYDKIYHLSQGDTIAKAIYNASGIPFVPGQFGTGNANIFDDGGGCNQQGCAVSLTNGSINLARSLRNGAIPSINNAQKEFTYYYRMDDPSDKALIKMKIKLYYYNRVADIPQYLWDILLIDHAGTILAPGLQIGTARPRPPCVIVVGQD